MTFDKSKYLINEDGLVFKQISTDSYDQIIKGLKIRNQFEESNTSHFYSKKIDVNDIKSNFLMIKAPLMKHHTVNISNPEVASLNNAISVNIQDIRAIMKNKDIPNITNGIRNSAYFLTDPKQWPRVTKSGIDENQNEIENNMEDNIKD